MDTLQEYRLSQETKGFRRLVWILQMKQAFPWNPGFKKEFNLLRDKQIIILKSDGHDYKGICDKTRKYKCIWEMFN